MATQAKCIECRVRYAWIGDVPLKRAYCPACGAKLLRTTCANRMVTRRRGPISPPHPLITQWRTTPAS